MIIVKEMLVAMDACPEQVEIFATAWPDGVELTMGVLQQMSRIRFSIDWLVETCLPDTALAKYRKACKALLIEYNRVCGPALVKYRKVCDPALAKYRKAYRAITAKDKKAREILLTEYERACGPVWIEYKRVCDGSAWTKYEEAYYIMLVSIIAQLDTANS